MTSAVVAISPKMPPSTPIMANAALCRSRSPEAQASLTVIQQYPRSIAVRNVELTHTSVVTPVNRTMALLLKVYLQQRRWVRNRITPSVLLAFDVVRNGRTMRERETYGP